MKKIFNYILFILLNTILIFPGCVEDDEGLVTIRDQAPENVNAKFSISDDDTGALTVIPSGEGVSKFEILFGDITDEQPTAVLPGKSASHQYPEGNFVMTVAGISISGLRTEIVQDIVIRFDPPENLNVTVEVSNRSIVVTPSADGATLFEVFFGDVENEEPTVVMPGGVAEHIYDAVGDYEVKVVAKGAGAATLEFTETVTISESIVFPVDFEAGDISYNFTGFGGAATAVADNPFSSGINTSLKAARFLKTSGAEVFAGTILEMGSPIDFASNRSIKLKTYAPKSGITVKLKVENLTNPDVNAEIDVTNTTANEWEELLFDFDGIDLVNEYQKIIVFFDFGNAGDASEYWFDDIELTNEGGVCTPVASPVEDFEGAAPVFTVFGNIAATQVTANPDASGTNTTANVAKLVKSAGSEVWAGTFFETNVLELATTNQISVKTYAPKSGIVVKLKLENADAGITHEVDIVNTVANQWEELVYDFSGAPAADYIRVVIFFDFGVAGDDSEYFYDAITLTNGCNDPGGGAVVTPVENFELIAPAFTVFGNIAPTEVLANPDMSGINTSANTAKLTKSTGSEVWAGTFFEVGSPLDLSTYSNISVKTWSPKSGIVVKFKLENADSSITHEVDITNNVANGWEQLIYDFSGAPAADYVRLVIFFDFGNAGDDSGYFFDEIELTN